MTQLLRMALLLLLIAVSSGQQIVRSAQRAATLAGSTTMRLPGVYCAVATPMGRTTTAIVQQSNNFSLPISAAVVALTFRPVSAASTIPSTRNCGGTAANPSLTCGSSYAAAVYCAINASAVEPRLAAAGASRTDRLIAASQDLVVTGGSGSPEYAQGEITLLLGRRMQRGAACALALVTSESPAAQVCGTVELHVVPTWNATQGATSASSAAGTSPFVPQVLYNAGAQFTSAGMPNSGWFTAWTASAASVGNVTGPTFVTDVLVSAGDLCVGNAGCAVVHTAANLPAVYAGTHAYVVAVNSSVTSLADAATVCASANSNTIPASGVVSNADATNATMWKAVFAALYPLASRLNATLLIHDKTPPSGFSTVFVSAAVPSGYVAAAPNDGRPVLAVCQYEEATALVAGWLQVARPRTPCPLRSTRDSCRSDATFCRYSMNSDGVTGTCCWNGAFVGTNETLAAVGVVSACKTCATTWAAVETLASWDWRCRVNASNLNLRTLVSQTCAAATDQAQCLADSYRCNSADLDGIITASNAMTAGCRVASVSSRRCIDPSLTCFPAPVTLPPTPVPTLPNGSPAFTTPAPTLIAYVPVTSSTHEVSAEAIRNSVVVISITISPLFKDTYWNTSVKAADFETLLQVASTPGWRFGLEKRHVPLVSSANVTNGGKTVDLWLGRVDSFAPVWHQDIIFRGTAALWRRLPTDVVETRSFADVSLRLQDQEPSQTRRQTAYRFVLAGSIIGLLGGFTGWIGLAALHPTIVASSLNCAPPRVRNVFHDAAWLVAPASGIDDTAEFVFGVQVGVLLGITFCTPFLRWCITQRWGACRFSPVPTR
jgi:hypothetical protein